MSPPDRATPLAKRAALVAALAFVLISGIAGADTYVLSTPTGGVHFGTAVKLLPNGNIVIADADFTIGSDVVGAAFLYGPDGHLISTLTGSSDGDHVGSNGIVVLANGNYLVMSTNWKNGAATNAGAVTWGDATSGVNGTVSPANSFVGSSANDFVGRAVALTNGNYVVVANSWSNGAIQDVGAVAWGNGASGSAGSLSAENALIGSSAGDAIGAEYFSDSDVVALPNGHYVVPSPRWTSGNDSVGAATWCNGSVGCAGEISASNSLVGTTQYGGIGVAGVAVLSNGNYVVSGDKSATWGNAATGVVGAVSSANSLIGPGTASHSMPIVTPLTNGNYVMYSPYYNGAAVLGNGTSGTVGVLSPAMALVGIGGLGTSVTVLTNGNYVINSYLWNSPTASQVGASTWGDGATGVTGTISASNSLVGTAANDFVGALSVALSDGNYVVLSPTWANGSVTYAGAATWANGNGGTIGAVSTANSLVGTHQYDYVGDSASALQNGAYVVASRLWNNVRGAVTWMSGPTAGAGSVSAANSLIGVDTHDTVSSDGIVVLADGSYVVLSGWWSNGADPERGAVTWLPGNAPTTGVISPLTSFVGTHDADLLKPTVQAFANGTYVVSSSRWNGTAGAVTLLRAGPTGATVTADNSITGTHTGNLPSPLGMPYAYDAARDQLVVGVPDSNVVKILRPDTLFRGDFE